MTGAVRDVEVSFGRTRALDGVTLEVPPGAVTCVVGGDGAGKTTLLRTLSGVIAPNRGSVDRPARDRTGSMPASSGTYPDLTVEENLDFIVRVYRLDGHDAAERSAFLLDATGMSDVRHRLAKDLSGGMRQKLGLICALIHRPDLVVLDEPTTGVDPVSRGELWALIVESAAAGAAVVVTTTYFHEAERAQSLYLLDHGRVLASGSAATIKDTAPGWLYLLSARPPQEHAVFAWRRGRQWRLWLPPNGAATHKSWAKGLAKLSTFAEAAGRLTSPDLQDALTMWTIAERLSEPSVRRCKS